MNGLKPFTETTAQDARAMIRARFGEEDCSLADKYLHNPLRVLEASVGDVAYENGVAVGFQAAVLRRLHRGQEAFFGVTGGLLCLKEGASPVLLVDLMKASIAPRGGSIFFYSNTANVSSMKMNRLLGVKGSGPMSCERIRFTVTYWPRILKWLLPSAEDVRLDAFDRKMFSGFWTKYLEGNKGVVTSRQIEELEWIFGERIRRGECVAMGHIVEGRLQGYIIIKSTHAGRRWLIVDWIALGDDSHILRSLLRSAVRYVRKYTAAFALESIGFPDKAQPILRSLLPMWRRATNNSFLWKFSDKRQEGIPGDSWFFGPYDGDRCM